MKKFGKKILTLFMALMCIATIGAITASASDNFYNHWQSLTPKQSDKFSSQYFYKPNSQYSFHAHYKLRDTPKGYAYAYQNRWAKPGDKYDSVRNVGVKKDGSLHYLSRIHHEQQVG